MVKKLINKMEQIIETESNLHRKARKAINSPFKKKIFSVSTEEIDEILEGVEARISREKR